MYSVGDQFNRAAKRLDKRLEEVGGSRMYEVGLGDDQHSELYRTEMYKWLETVLPKLFGKEGGGASMLDPPEPLFKLAYAPGIHKSTFRPLPPKYHFVKLASAVSQVAKGYDRPASIFTFDLEDTGVQYDVGDHLAILPRNPESVVEQVLRLYSPHIKDSDLLTVEPVDPHSECAFPPVVTVKELLTQYLDICGRPSRSFFKQLFLFATSLDARNRLRSLFERGPPKKDSDQDPHITRLRTKSDFEKMLQEEFELYTATHNYADVLSEFGRNALPPFEYLLSMVPVIRPRLYSIASSPLFDKKRLDLLVVLNEWTDPTKKVRTGLTTQFLFEADIGDKVAVQVRTGILQPPSNPQTPIVMFGLGTGVAPFRGFMQHRESLQKQGQKLGTATLYVGFRHEEKDYYLAEEFHRWTQQGILSAVHPAFSHDNREQRGGKLYFISDLIEEKPKDMAAALLLQQEQESKVHTYYCGPAVSAQFPSGNYYLHCLFVDSLFVFCGSVYSLVFLRLFNRPWKMRSKTRRVELRAVTKPRPLWIAWCVWRTASMPSAFSFLCV